MRAWLVVIAMNGGWAKPEMMSTDALALMVFVVSTVVIEYVIIKYKLKQPMGKTLRAVLLANILSYMAGIASITVLGSHEIPLFYGLVMFVVIIAVTLGLIVNALTPQKKGSVA